MKRFLILGLLGICPFVSLPAQEAQPKPATKSEETKPEAPLPTADQILDKYVEATGGKSAIEKITSRKTTGTFDIPAMGATGTFEGFSKAPNKNALVIDMPGFGQVRQGFDGAAGWDDNPMVGMRDLSGPELVAKKFDSEFYKSIRIREMYPDLSVKGREKVGEREAYVIEGKPESLPAEKLYFDTETGLLLRQDVQREGPQGVATVETVFEDYKEVDGVKLPHNLKITNPAFMFVIKLSEIKHNISIDDSVFTKPAPKPAP
jgi:hypothetical protein